jgi:hypothetical protein
MTGTNMFRAPGARNFDAAISKSFAMTERLKLEFRAEGFDVFNHYNFYVLETNLDAANFTGVPITVSALKGGLGISTTLAGPTMMSAASGSRCGLRSSSL